MKSNENERIDFIEAKAFGCFGSISCFSRDSEYCQRCPAFEACEQKSYETLNAIKQVVNVNDLFKQHEKARMAQEAKRRALREEMNAVKSLSSGGIQPKKPTLVERATKVEKVFFEPTPEQQELIVKLPVKAQSFALTLVKSGLVTEIKEGLAKNENAMKGKTPVWLSLAVEKLLLGGYTRSELKKAFMEELNWKENTAQSHVSLAFVLLTCFGIAKEESSKLLIFK
ncbi:hypothetical protein ABTO90_13350 [Acinetobacter baumannii]|uniref:hypothetical protein n=1 Tax=Acinetobacter baumannii TaxID=470 RepID=UPI001FB44874|nr:hypothetical protein [Acinetobacter baumannii]MCJ1637067.1 hypothetical protein [Acinetobacter baumannii]MDT1830596.1 hypothetical protein [Acinetobacter baumannii]